MSENVTRRGFLSLCFTTAAVAALPSMAEPQVFVPFPANPNIHRLVERYSLGMRGAGLVQPGEVITLRAIPSVSFRPDRLLMSCGGFNILHLDTNGVAIFGQGEIPSDLFAMGSHARLDFASLNPGEELVIAAVNRNKEPKQFSVGVVGYAMTEETEEQYQARQAYLAADGLNYESDDD